MDRLLVAEAVWQAIRKDVRAHPDVETGGVFGGLLYAGDYYILFHIPAGPSAKRSQTGFAPEAAFQQTILDYLNERFAVDYVGDWHRHPGRFDRPSAHDYQTARQIVESSAWNKPEAVFPIVTVVDGEIRMRAYVMKRQSPDFQEIPIEIISDRDDRILSLFQGGFDGASITEERLQRRGAHRACGDRPRDSLPRWLRSRIWLRKGCRKVASNSRSLAK